MPLLDRFIDGEKIRNRSHAIEFILSQHLGLGIQHAVILAGSTSDGVVNALTRVRNRPVIAYWFDELKAYGIRDVILVVDSNGQALRDYIGDGMQWGLNIRYVDSSSAQGTGAALALVKPYVQQQFLLLYADVLADLNLSDMMEHHQQTGAVGTVALTYKTSAWEYGVARLEGSSIVEFEEKPGEGARHGLVNSGIFLFSTEIFSYLSESTVSLEQDVLPRVATKGELSGYPFHGTWFDLSDARGLAAAEKEWKV